MSSAVPRPLRLVLATANRVKRGWLSDALTDEHLAVDEELVPDDIAETGSTCEANARLKATSIGPLAGRVVVAEDSGLFVDGLDGFPCTHTARWVTGTDDDRARALLDRCVGLSGPDRSARFESVVVLLFPDGRTEVHRGALRGSIREHYEGRSGDGYAAIFEPDRPEPTTANETIAAGDHRHQALERARASLREYARSRP